MQIHHTAANRLRMRLYDSLNASKGDHRISQDFTGVESQTVSQKKHCTARPGTGPIFLTGRWHGACRTTTIVLHVVRRNPAEATAQRAGEEQRDFNTHPSGLLMLRCSVLQLENPIVKFPTDSGQTRTRATPAQTAPPDAPAPGLRALQPEPARGCSRSSRVRLPRCSGLSRLRVGDAGCSGPTRLRVGGAGCAAPPGLPRCRGGFICEQ